MRLKFKVLGDNVLVRCDDFVEKTASGLIIPKTHGERSRTATVFGVGPDVKECKVGDKVLVSWTAGARIHRVDDVIVVPELNIEEPISEDFHRIMREYEVVSKIEEV
jgi:co-chaperonin GroES (HSP10)